jgi:hypothetical protein
LNINSFFQPVEELIYYPQIEQAINGKHRIAIFILDSYPDDRLKDLSSVELSLLRDGFNRVINGPVIYYLRINE